MDEPFGALDALTRESLQVELRQIQMREAKTIIFVTHDVEEAVFLADRIIMLSSPAGLGRRRYDVARHSRQEPAARDPRDRRISSS